MGRTEGMKVCSIRFVMDVFHTNMEGFDSEVGNVDFGTASQEFKQAERVLATRQADEDAVVLVDKLVLSQCFVKLFPKSFVERHGLVCCCATATYGTIS